MPIDANGQWYPNLSPKQLIAYNDMTRYQLLSGPRISGKTVVGVHKMIRHAWLNDNARVGLFVKSTKIGKVGAWDDTLTYALPEWCGTAKEPDDPDYDPGLSEEGFRITFGPAVDGATRLHYIRIANRHGGTSEIQLHSLHHDDSADEKLKGSRFSMFFFDEVDVYESEEVFNLAILQLRMIGMPYDKHCWIGTCNPAGDDSHWLYKKFYLDPLDLTRKESYRKSFSLHEFKLSDNIYLSDEAVTNLKETYAGDPLMYDRYINGLWVPDMRRSFFGDVFRETTHVKGNSQEGTIILPTDDCAEIYIGVDPGDVNHAAVFLERVNSLEGEYWTVLDEISHIKEDVSIEMLTYEITQKMDELSRLCKKPPRFKVWMDASVFDRYRASAGVKDSMLFYKFSGGRIEPIGCPKGPGSVLARVALVRQLLVQRKLFLSVHCRGTIEALKKLQRGRTKGEPILREKQGHIHRFDALSYALFGEMMDQLQDAMRPKVGAVAEAFSL